MSETSLVAQRRTEFGKGAARRTRRAGLIPAVLYGHGSDPIHVSLPGHETFQLLRQANALLRLDLEGQQILGLAREVQRDPIRPVIEHIDLIIVKEGEKVEVEVPVHVQGEPFPGSIAITELQTVRLLVEATKVPEAVIVDVTGLEDGTLIHTGGLTLPEGAELAEADDLLVVSITEPRSTETPEEEAGEEAAVADE